jgi:hypothetical protein
MSTCFKVYWITCWAPLWANAINSKE